MHCSLWNSYSAVISELLETACSDGWQHQNGKYLLQRGQPNSLSWFYCCHIQESGAWKKYADRIRLRKLWCHLGSGRDFCRSANCGGWGRVALSACGVWKESGDTGKSKEKTCPEYPRGRTGDFDEVEEDTEAWPFCTGHFRRYIVLEIFKHTPQ